MDINCIENGKQANDIFKTSNKKKLSQIDNSSEVSICDLHDEHESSNDESDEDPSNDQKINDQNGLKDDELKKLHNESVQNRQSSGGHENLDNPNEKSKKCEEQSCIKSNTLSDDWKKLKLLKETDTNVINTDNLTESLSFIQNRSSDKRLSSPMLARRISNNFSINSPSTIRNSHVISTNSLGLKLFLLFFSILIPVLAVSLIDLKCLNLFDKLNYGNGESFKNDQTRLVYQQRFKTYFGRLKEKYTRQTDVFWANIESSFRHSVLKSLVFKTSVAKPIDPSIVLLVHEPQTAQLVNEFNIDLLNCFYDILDKRKNINSLIINPQESYMWKLIQEEKFDVIKLKVDQKLERLFESGEKFALVKNVHLLPAISMIPFYSYGDYGDMAKFQGILILITLELDSPITSAHRKQLQESTAELNSFVERYLYKLWSPFIGDDQLLPLFTRIANNVILINPETNNSATI